MASGNRLIQLELTHELKGRVELDCEKVGLRVSMAFPRDGSEPARVRQGLG